jgi:hypothetical protein
MPIILKRGALYIYKIMLRLASYTFLVVALNSEGVVRIWDARLEYHRYILMILDPIFDTILFIVEF